MFRSITIAAICLGLCFVLVALSANSTSELFGVPTFLVCVCVAFFAQWISFIPAYLKQTEHFYDLVGTLSFLLIIAIALWSAGSPTQYELLLASMVALWAIRLGMFLTSRIRVDGKDTRFTRIKPNKHRFFVAWTLQGLWVVISSSAAVMAIISSNKPITLAGVDSVLVAVGVAMFVVGFAIESIADWQKRLFRKRQSNEQQFINSGLWAYSQHPNYFGEIVLWLGIAIASYPALFGWQQLFLVSPIFVFLLLTRVSGVPMLKARDARTRNNNPAYQDYIRVTPELVPFSKMFSDNKQLDSLNRGIGD